jgi:hypothetical protein
MSVRGQRIVLMLLLAMAAFPGSWALAAPRSFYDSFPGAGMHWVSADGPYNRHLVTDVGAMYTALMVVTAGALVSRTPAVTTLAGAAWLTFSLPHWAYHAAHLQPGLRDQLLNEVALGGAVVLAALLCVPRGRWTGTPVAGTPVAGTPVAADRTGVDR